MTAFLGNLGAGKAEASDLTTRMLKAVGKPLTQDDKDKARGYSADKAASWLNRVGQGMTFSPALDRKQAGDRVYVRGSLQGKPGTYSLRLVKEGGAWKVDLLVLSSAEWQGTPNAGTAEAAFLEFTVTAFIAAVADSNVIAIPADRAPMIAAAMTPALRSAWGSPYDQLKPQGYDYNPTILARKATEIAAAPQRSLSRASACCRSSRLN